MNKEGSIIMNGFKGILLIISLLFLGCVEGPQGTSEPPPSQAPPDAMNEEDEEVPTDPSSGPNTDTGDGAGQKPDLDDTGEDGEVQPPIVADAQEDSAYELDTQEPEDMSSPPQQPGNWEVSWMHGAPDCNDSSDPPIQIHPYNEDTFVLRQSKCLHFEAPFLYLLFGEQKVFLQDTGAVTSLGSKGNSINNVVEEIIADWLKDRGRTRASMELLVTHSHSHADHIQGDEAFSGQPNTTVVGPSLSSVQSFFGFEPWPTDLVTLDLGGRVLEITGIPGHHPTSIAVYDEQTGLLLTGDTLYPGHLFIPDYETYRTSIQRMADWMSNHDPTWIVGTHVEMSAEPGVTYPYGSTYQPNEHTLQMEIDVLTELADILPPSPLCLVLDHVSVEPSNLGCQ